MKVIKQDLFTLHNQLRPVVLAVTGNGIINGSRLVMGAGAAEELVRWSPKADEQAAVVVRKYGVRRRESYTYGFVAWGPSALAEYIGLLQTKHHFQDKADLKLIEHSVTKLLEWIAWNPGFYVRCNYPGIGLGGLTRAQVEPLLAELPDSVTFCVK